MSLFAEALESRTLFAAVPISPTLAANYAALVQDDNTLKADLKTYTAALTADVKLLGIEVKRLGKSPGNNPLLAEIKKDAATVTSADTAATTKYLGIASPEFRKTELTVAAFSAKPNLANGHKLSAVISACDALENASDDPRFAPLIQKAGDAADDLVTTIDALAAANPSSTQLAGGVAAVNNDVENLSNIQGGAADDAQAAIQALFAS